MKPQEVPKEVPRGFLASQTASAGGMRKKGSVPEEERREKRRGKRPQEKVLKIRGYHEDGRQLESLHFYGVP